MLIIVLPLEAMTAARLKTRTRVATPGVEEPLPEPELLNSVHVPLLEVAPVQSTVSEQVFEQPAKLVPGRLLVKFVADGN